MRTSCALSLITAVMFSSASFAQQQTAAPAAAPLSQGDRILAALTELKSDLQASYREYTGSDAKVVESYLNALAHTEAALQYATDNLTPGEPPSLARRQREKAAREQYVACSLHAELAFTQIRNDQAGAELAGVTARRDTVASQISTVYQSIIDLERGKASDLKNRLDAENDKTRKLQREMEKRFRELESALIRVRRDARGTIVSMSDLLFAFDKADLTNELKNSLAKIAGILMVYTECKVIVEGHTDNIGTAAYNQDLSERRAVAVKGYLVEQSIKTERLSAAGYGMNRPIASNATRDGRQKNRRVDLVIIEK